MINAGLLAIEHEGIHEKYDGMCLSLKILVELSGTEESIISTNSEWVNLRDQVLAEKCLSQEAVPFLYKPWNRYTVVPAM